MGLPLVDKILTTEIDRFTNTDKKPTEWVWVDLYVKKWRHKRDNQKNKSQFKETPTFHSFSFS